MKTFAVVLFACLVVFARATPSGIWGHGVGHGLVHGGPVTIVGASGVVGPNGAAGPTGAVNGHGAVGPNGIPNAIGHAGVLGVGLGGVGLGGVGLGGVGLGGVGIAAGLGAHGWDGDDGQWHGEGLLASQDLAGHGAAVIAPGIAAGIVGGHGLGLGLGLGHGAHW